MIFKLVEKLEDDATQKVEASTEKDTQEQPDSKNNSLKNKKDPKQIIMDIKKKTNAKFIES